MRAAPRAASGSRAERAFTIATGRLPAVRRLRSAAQFVAVTSDPQALREARRWLSLAGLLRAGGAAVPVRFGFTASRRHARRAVDRNAAKRVLREAARRHLEELDAAAAACSIDVVLRLKSRAPEQGVLARAAWKRELAAEADLMLARLAARLRAGAAVGP